MQIPLGYIMFTNNKPIEVPSQENTLTLTTCLRLDDKCLCLLVVELNLEVLRVLWEQPCFGEKVEIRGANLFHGHQVFGEQVLSGKRIHAREMISTLVHLHL